MIASRHVAPVNYWGLTKQVGPWRTTSVDRTHEALGYDSPHNQVQEVRPYQQDGSKAPTYEQVEIVSPDNINGLRGPGLRKGKLQREIFGNLEESRLDREFERAGKRLKVDSVAKLAERLDRETKASGAVPDLAPSSDLATSPVDFSFVKESMGVAAPLSETEIAERLKQSAAQVGTPVVETPIESSTETSVSPASSTDSFHSATALLDISTNPISPPPAVTSPQYPFFSTESSPVEFANIAESESILDHPTSPTSDVTFPAVPGRDPLDVTTIATTSKKLVEQTQKLASARSELQNQVLRYNADFQRMVSGTLANEAASLGIAGELQTDRARLETKLREARAGLDQANHLMKRNIQARQTHLQIDTNRAPARTTVSPEDVVMQSPSSSDIVMASLSSEGLAGLTQAMQGATLRSPVSSGTSRTSGSPGDHFGARSPSSGSAYSPSSDSSASPIQSRVGPRRRVQVRSHKDLFKK